MAWEPFERHAAGYEAWYETARGRRVAEIEWALLEWLLAGLGESGGRLLEVGSGSGHFGRRLSGAGWRVVGLDRAPAMLRASRGLTPAFPVILGDAARLPCPDGGADLVLCLTSLEFLPDPAAALAEGVRVARRALLLVVMNRWSLGGLSRRLGPQSRRPLLSQARDYSLGELAALARTAAGERLRSLAWTSTLFPGPLRARRARLPLGDVLGLAVGLAPPAGRSG